MASNPLEPVLTTHLFPEERRALLALLSSLSGVEWRAPTVCPGWSVKDIAAHLLADDIGRLSRGRDGYPGADFAPPTSPDHFEAELLENINRQNELWVAAARRLSPHVIVDLLRWSGEQTQAYFDSLNPFVVGEPVSWAGPEPAPVWLDIAREYTERWLHQQQIRDAVGKPGLTDRETFAPVLETFVRALPHTFRHVDAPETTHVRLTVTGDAHGEWSLVRHDSRWALFSATEAPPNAAVTMDADTAWRLFTKGISKAAALDRVAITGDRLLGEKILETVSIIA